MNVLTVAVAGDEEDMIPYFVRHYRHFSDVTIYDDSSSDNTASLARAEGATVLPLENPDNTDIDYRLLWAKNHSWKPLKNEYDWVIAVDVDEFLYHDDLYYVLRRARELRATVLAPCGYQMISSKPPSGPEPLTVQIRRGVPCPFASKLCCFDPKKISDINFNIGGHYAAPYGHVLLLPYPGLKLLHYHHLGLEWTMAKYVRRRRRRLRMPSAHWHDYEDTIEHMRGVFAALDAEASEII